MSSRANLAGFDRDSDTRLRARRPQVCLRCPVGRWHGPPCHRTDSSGSCPSQPASEPTNEGEAGRRSARSLQERKEGEHGPTCIADGALAERRPPTPRAPPLGPVPSAGSLGMGSAAVRRLADGGRYCRLSGSVRTADGRRMLLRRPVRREAEARTVVARAGWWWTAAGAYCGRCRQVCSRRHHFVHTVSFTWKRKNGVLLHPQVKTDTTTATKLCKENATHGQRTEKTGNHITSHKRY